MKRGKRGQKILMNEKMRSKLRENQISSSLVINIECPNACKKKLLAEKLCMRVCLCSVCMCVSGNEG